MIESSGIKMHLIGIGSYYQFFCNDPCPGFGIRIRHLIALAFPCDMVTLPTTRFLRVKIISNDQHETFYNTLSSLTSILRKFIGGYRHEIAPSKVRLSIWLL